MPAAPSLPHPDLADIALGDVLFALSDPARLAIVRELVDGPVEMGGCAAIDPSMPKATKSHLMKVLREAGIIRNEPAGRQRIISLRADELERRFPGLLPAILSAR